MMYNGLAFNRPVIVVRKLLGFVTHDGYKDYYKRSYDIHLDHGNYENILNVFNHYNMNRGGKIPYAATAQLPNIVGIGSQVLGKIEIPHGWSTKRLRYILELEVNVNGIVFRTYCQGYSEYYDSSYTGYIDPNMEFFINSISTVVKQRGPDGHEYFTPQIGFNMLYDARTHEEVYHELTRQEYLDRKKRDYVVCRPEDIMIDLSMSTKYAGADVFNTTKDLEPGTTKVSKFSNNDPAQYLRHLLNSYTAAMSISNEYDDNSGVYDEASVMTRENSALDVHFLKALYEHSGVLSANSFSLNLLKQIDPTFEQRGHSAMSPLQIFDSTQSVDLSSVNTFGLDSADTLAPNIENIKALGLLTALSSKMFDQLITKFTVALSTYTGEILVTPLNVNSIFEGIDIIRGSNAIVDWLAHIYHYTLSDSGALNYQISGDFDLLGDSFIKIAINGGPEYMYRYPTFASNLYSPLVTNREGFRSLASNVKNLNDAIVHGLN